MFHCLSNAAPRIRTQRQQEQNKKAQQRYRARKRQKAVQMESQVMCMQQQMAELQRVMRHNVSLQVSLTTPLPICYLSPPFQLLILSL